MEPLQSFPTSLRWVGCGRPAFVGDAGSGPENVPVRVDGYARFEQVFGGSAGGSTAFRRALRAYFECGGESCYVLHLPGLERVPEARAAVLLLGEEGEPGYRTGLHALSDPEDVSAVAVPGVTNAACREAVLDYARRKPSKSVVLEGPAGSRPPESLAAKLRDVRWQAPGGGLALLERVAWLPLCASSQGGPLPPSGPALGLLETLDFDPAGAPRTPHSLRLPSACPEELRRALEAGVPTLGRKLGSLWAWRRWEGLRRSLDLGTRWLLFEVQDRRLRARVEREVTAFLHTLTDAGLLERTREQPGYDIRSRSVVRKTHKGAQGCLEINVRVALGADGQRGMRG